MEPCQHTQVPRGLPGAGGPDGPGASAGDGAACSGATQLYRERRAPEVPDDLPVLAAFDPEHLAGLLQTQQRTGGALKAAAITEAARRLSAAGVRHAADLDPAAAEQRAAYCGVRGLGPVTWEYLLMLVGRRALEQATG